MGAVFFRDFKLVDMLGRKAANLFKEVVLQDLHFLEVVFPSVGSDKILDFHLGTFAVAEDKVARADFVPEGFALLGEAER